MSKGRLVHGTVLMIFLIILQSTLFTKLPGNYIYPDLALLVLVFFSNGKGTMQGQLSGFASGLAEDFLSLSPLGFNSFIRTVTGFMFGGTRGKIFIDPVFFPVIMAAAATLLKGFTAVLVSSLFLKPEAAPAVFGVKFFIEMAENCIAAPFVFALMKLLRLYKIEDRGL